MKNVMLQMNMCEVWSSDRHSRSRTASELSRTDVNNNAVCDMSMDESTPGRHSVDRCSSNERYYSRRKRYALEDLSELMCAMKIARGTEADLDSDGKDRLPPKTSRKHGGNRSKITLKVGWRRRRSHASHCSSPCPPPPPSPWLLSSSSGGGGGGDGGEESEDSTSDGDGGVERAAGRRPRPRQRRHPPQPPHQQHQQPRRPRRLQRGVPATRLRHRGHRRRRPYTRWLSGNAPRARLVPRARHRHRPRRCNTWRPKSGRPRDTCRRGGDVATGKGVCSSESRCPDGVPADASARAAPAKRSESAAGAEVAPEADTGLASGAVALPATTWSSWAPRWADCSCAAGDVGARAPERPV